MAAPPPPPNFADDWLPDIGGSGGSSPYTLYQQGLITQTNLPLFKIITAGFDQFIRKTYQIDRDWAKESLEILADITEEVREAAQERSPYLYGILHDAHRDTVDADLDGDLWGIVHIATDVWHPILGGQPHLYGARIHGEDRPWFGWTADEAAPEIIERHAGRLVDVYAHHIGGEGISGGIF